ncbi:MAG: hypothetical protein ACFCU1_07435 [Sumerlaeia bacterium]
MKNLLPYLLFPLTISCVHGNQLPLPARNPNAPSGTEFYNQLIAANDDVEEREREVYRQIISGNIPDSHREFVPVEITDGQNTVTLYVTPDYLSVGNDSDYFHLPMTPILGQLLADYTNCILPTRKMVDEIWRESAVKLNPTPIPPSPAMVTVPVFWDHEQTLRTQFTAAGLSPQQLVGGHKKDVVITPRLYLPGNDDNVAIYGWHYPTGGNIQPLYLGHADFYADYSHGIRLISETALLNGVQTSLRTLLTDFAVADLLSNEGPLTPAEYPIKFVSVPVQDQFSVLNRQIPRWQDRFATHPIVSFLPVAPGGDGIVLLVRDPSGGIDSARLQPFADYDYTITAMIYCDFRPQLATDGFDRVGIFVRDDGNGMFEGISSSNIKGNNYALTWDSDTGSVQCLNTTEGIPVNLLSEPLLLPSSGWREFQITAQGDELAFFLDQQLILRTTDSTHPTGDFGIGYHEYFATNSNLTGTRVDRFAATPPSSIVTASTWLAD